MYGTPMSKAETHERHGSQVLAVHSTAGSTTLVDDDTLFFTTLPGPARRLVSTETDSLVEVRRDQHEMWLISPARPGAEQTRLFSTPEPPVAAAMTTAMVAVVSASRQLTVHSVVGQSEDAAMTMGSSSAVPSYGSGVIRAVGITMARYPYVVAVAVGPAIVLFSVSAAFQLDSTHRVVRLPSVVAVPTVYSVRPLDESGNLWAATETELIGRLGETTVQVKLPEAIGRPVSDILCISSGVVVVAPAGVWGISFMVHAQRRMHGRRFVCLCHGAHGAIPTEAGDGVVVWKEATGGRTELRLTDVGFVSM
tara:strand:- start:8521 stop:9447 length:927 start_codon:yes stop_codon:yes gene_type:complete